MSSVQERMAPPGYYFIHTDLGNTRAHTSQILQTIVPLQERLSIELVAPRYRATPMIEELVARHGLARSPHVTFLSTLGAGVPSTMAFVAFNVSAILFLVSKKLDRNVGFIYVRSTLFLPLVMAARVLRVPFFYETHRVPQSGSEAGRDTWMAKRAQGLIIISEYVRKYYARFGKPMIVAHDAVSLSRFAARVDRAEARARFGVSGHERLCVYTGTVSLLKGADYLLEAAKRLPDVRFLFAGIIAPEFAQAVLPPNVTLLGQREQKELPMLLAAADVLVLPHPQNEYSQSPMKLFEYLASRTPVVASRLPSICEILHEGNAVLVEPEDPAALARGISTVLEDRALAERLATRAHEDVQEYTWEKRAERLAAFVAAAMKP